MSDKDIVPTTGAAMSDDQIVDFTQGVRKQLVDDMTERGTAMPKEKGDRIVLLAALADMDRTAVAKMKIGSKERQGAADREAALIAARLHSQYGSKSPFAIQRSSDDEDVIDGEYAEIRAPELDTTALPALEIKPGETDIGISTTNYEQFMGKMEGTDLTPEGSDAG